MELLLEVLPWAVGGGTTGIVGLLGFGMYKADAMGWKSDMRRISRNIRARINSGKAVKALEVKAEDAAKAIEEDWVAQFEGKDIPTKDIDNVTKKSEKHFVIIQFEGKRRKFYIDHPELKHEIVKKYYYNAFGTQTWPAFLCKCGAIGKQPTEHGRMTNPEKQLDVKADEHVRAMNANDEKMKKNGNKFAW